MSTTASTDFMTETDGVPAAPRSTDRPRPFGIVRHSTTLAGRSIKKIIRTPEQLIDVTLQPILFIVIFVYLFGGSIAGNTHDYLQYVLPGLMTQTLLFSAVSIGVNLNTDIEKGIFDRFRSLPIPRSAPLIGAVLGDMVRFVVSVVVTLGFGLIIGFDPRGNWLLVLAGAGLALLFTMALSWVFVLLGMVLRTSGAVQGIGFMAMFPLTFGSSMLVQANTLPGWLQAWVNINPVSHLTEAVRGLMVGGPIQTPVLQSLAWIVGIAVVFAPLAVRAYRRKA